MIEENLAPAKNSVATEKAEKPHRAKPRASRPLSPKSAAAPKTTSSASKAKPKAKPKDASKVVPKKSPSDSPTGLKPPKAPKTPKIPPALGPVSATKAPRATKSLTTKSPKTAQAATPVRAKKPGSPVAAALITKPRVRKTPSQALDSLKVAKAARAARAARAAHVELDEALISKSDLIKAERLAKDHLKEEKELKKAPFKPRTRDKKGAERPIGRALADLVSKAAQEHKLNSPVLLDLRGLSSVTDWFFVASAENSRQIRAAAEKIIQRSLEAGVKPLGHEGLGRGDLHWALVDLGDVVAHIFNAETRALYDLEGLWADAPRG